MGRKAIKILTLAHRIEFSLDHDGAHITALARFGASSPSGSRHICEEEVNI